MSIAPLVRIAHTKAPPARAFEIFTGQMGRWWPRGQTVGAHPHANILIEPRIGGRWFERDDEGRETQWGHVLAWDPPGRLLLAWQLDAPRHVYDPDLITEVELSFTPAPGGTEVRLEHRHLERFRTDAIAGAASVTRGWTRKIVEFAQFADQSY